MRSLLISFVAIASLVVLAGCADQSKGTALNECRLVYYLESPAAQAEAIPDCMRAKSFEAETACNAAVDDDEWDWQVKTFAFDNPNCYRPLGSATWVATLLSPM
jgi:hypothetical protein